MHCGELETLSLKRSTVFYYLSKILTKESPVTIIVHGKTRTWETAVVLFSGILTATRYMDILDTSLIPFLQEKSPHDHCFQQDNDPKHTTYRAQDYFATKNQPH